MLHVAKQAADELAKDGIEVEIIDVRTLIPFDAKTCVEVFQEQVVSDFTRRAVVWWNRSLDAV